MFLEFKHGDDAVFVSEEVVDFVRHDGPGATTIRTRSSLTRTASVEVDAKPDQVVAAMRHPEAFARLEDERGPVFVRASAVWGVVGGYMFGGCNNGCCVLLRETNAAIYTTTPAAEIIRLLNAALAVPSGA